MPAVRFRPLSTEDLDGVGALFATCFSAPPWNEAWSRDAARARLAPMIRAPGARGMVAVHDGSIVGVALGQVEGWLDRPLFLLQEFCVSPAYRGDGVGTRLLTDLLRGVSAGDAAGAVYLLTDENSPAKAFYEKLGFAPSTRKIVMGAAIGDILSAASAGRGEPAEQRA